MASLDRSRPLPGWSLYLPHDPPKSFEMKACYTVQLVTTFALLAACGGGGGTSFSVGYGGSIEVPEGSSITLSGTTVGNSGLVTYAWVQLSGPAVALSSTTAEEPTFTSMDIPADATSTTLMFRVTATDAATNVATHDLTVNVRSADYVMAPRSTGLGTSELWLFDPSTGTSNRASLPYSGGPASFIGDLGFSFDRTAVIYEHTVALSGQLYRASLDGSTRSTLSTAPVGGAGGLFGWSESPVGGQIAYWGEIEHLTSEELYIVNADGTGRQTLLTAIAGWQDISELDWLNDGSRILVRGEIDEDDVDEVFSVLADGMGRTQINKTLVAGGSVQDYTLSPDQTQVIYAADADTDETTELYVASINGGVSIKLNGALTAGGDVVAQDWSPDGLRVIYFADQDTNDLGELYSVNPDGTGQAKLNGAIGVGQNLSPLGWVNGSSRFLYMGDQDTLGTDELYTVVQDGTGRVKLNGAMIGAGDVLTATEIVGQDKVAFTADDATDGVAELFVVDSDGLNRNRITTGTMGVGATGVTSFDVHGASSRIVYLADEDTNGVFELYTALFTGGGRTKLNAALVAGGDVQSFAISPTGSHVAYLADGLVDGEMEVFCVRVDSTFHSHLTASVPVTSAIGATVKWSEDGAFLSLHGDHEAGNDLGTYVVKPDGTGFVRILDGTPVGTITNSAEWSLQAE